MMSFSAQLMENIRNRNIHRGTDAIRLHRLSDQVFELSIEGKSFLLSLDAGLDFSFLLAEFMATMENG